MNDPRLTSEDPKKFRSWDSTRFCWCEATPEQAAALGYIQAPPGDGGCLMLNVGDNGKINEWLIEDEEEKQ